LWSVSEESGQFPRGLVVAFALTAETVPSTWRKPLKKKKLMNIFEDPKSNYNLGSKAVWGKFVCPQHYIVDGMVVRAFPLYQYEDDDIPYDYHYEVVGPKSHAEKIARRLGFR
jgi:hypothetical protein